MKECIESLAGLPLAFQPGTKWRYGLNLDVLALLIETISGKAYPDFLQERIFEPLGMVDTHFILPESKMERLTVLYTRDEDSGELHRRDIPNPLPMILWGGGEHCIQRLRTMRPSWVCWQTGVRWTACA